MPIPRYRPQSGLVLFSAGFRPFFLAAAFWAALAIPLWLLVFAGNIELPSTLAPTTWHVHEMVFGFAAATVAGFLLTAIPNWTGRMPLQGGPLIVFVLLWLAGRVAVLASARAGGPGVAAVADLAFPVVFVAVVAREILAGRNWRNLPMVAALALLLTGNLLVHAEALGWSATSAAGNRLGIATLLMLISLVGGRIVPSFTRNWLAKSQPGTTEPAPFDTFDRIVLAMTALALVLWVIRPDTVAAAPAELAAGLALAGRLARWQGGRAWREPLVFILHLGYGWLALGFILLALSPFISWLPPTAALHALTAGAVGTMTLAVMTRATLGHTGHALTASVGTQAIYAAIIVAAVARICAVIHTAQSDLLLHIAAFAWVAAFLGFALAYGPLLLRRDPRMRTAG
jgi:uncharacterized protein involved in response to NO